MLAACQLAASSLWILVCHAQLTGYARAEDDERVDGGDVAHCNDEEGKKAASPHGQALLLMHASESLGRCAWTSDRRIRDAFRHLVSQGEAFSPAPGLFVGRAYWAGCDAAARHLHIARAAGNKHPEWVFCGPTAALAHGLSISYRHLRKLHVVHATGGRWSSVSVEHYRSIGPSASFGDMVVAAQGLRLTSKERSVVDCMRAMEFADGLAVADSFLRQTGVDGVSLGQAVERCGAGLRGVGRARMVAARADGRSESGGESIARARMIELGFVAPELQAEFTDPMTGLTSRVDFLWELPDGSRVIGELDGRRKYVDPEMTGGRAMLDVLADERLRESRLTRNARVLRFSYYDLQRPRYFARLLDSFGVPRRC